MYCHNMLLNYYYYLFLLLALTASNKKADKDILFLIPCNNFLIFNIPYCILTRLFSNTLYNKYKTNFFGTLEVLPFLVFH